jgi:hypothetical protein
MGTCVSAGRENMPSRKETGWAGGQCEVELDRDRADGMKSGWA